jgi:hypothetical protein
MAAGSALLPVQAVSEAMARTFIHRDDSVEGGAVRGRYSMIGLEPDLIWRCHRGEASLCRPALGEVFLSDPRPAFESLRALLDDPHRDGRERGHHDLRRRPRHPRRHPPRAGRLGA